MRVIASRSHAGDVFKVAESAFGRRGGRVEEIVAAGSGYKALQVCVFVNPRRACARVTVVVLCVCQSTALIC